MSLGAQSYFAANKTAFSEAPAVTKRKRSFTIPLIDMVRPDSYWPQPLSIEQAFELLRHMIDAGGTKYNTPGRWGHVGVNELLIGRGVVGFSSIEPITGLKHLRETFHRAILARPASQGQIDWRNENGFNVTDTVTIKRPTYKPFDGVQQYGLMSESHIQKELERLTTGTKGQRMAVALNSVHKHAVDWLHCVKIEIHKDHGFSFGLYYGEDPKEGLASEWAFTIARTRDKESFIDTFARAIAVFDCLVHGKRNDADTADMWKYGDYSKDFVEEQIASLKGD